MRKDLFCLSVFGFTVTIIACFVLCIFYGYDCNEMIEASLIAVFTGCLFAAPSYIVSALTQKKETHERLDDALSAISKELDELQSMYTAASKTDEFPNDYYCELHNKAEQIDSLKRQIGKLVNERYVESLNVVQSLLSNLFDLCKKCRECALNKSFCEEIEKIIGECNTNIKSIYERKR